MSRFVPVGDRPTFLRALVYGAAATNPAGFALSFPQPRVITFDPNIRFFGGPDVRVAFPERIGDIRELIAAVREGAEPAGTLVLYGFSRVWDAINYALRNESRDTFYRKRSEYISAIVRATENLPCHVVFVAREKAVYAEPGAIVNGRTVSVDDSIAIGGIADLDRNTEYEVDLTLRITHDEAKGVDVARVVNSFWSEIPQGREIAAPSFADLAAMIAGGQAAGSTATVAEGDDIRLAATDSEGATIPATIALSPADPFNDLAVDVPQVAAQPSPLEATSSSCGASIVDEHAAYVDPGVQPGGDALATTDQTMFEICAKCDFFIENDFEGVMHLDNGDTEHDHDPEPSGDVRSLEQWRADRPELFPPLDVRYAQSTVIATASDAAPESPVGPSEGSIAAQAAGREGLAGGADALDRDDAIADHDEPAIAPEYTDEAMGELFEQLRALRTQRMGERAGNDARFASLSSFLQAKGVLRDAALSDEQRPLARKTIEDAIELTRSHRPRSRRLTPPPHLRVAS